MKKTLILIAAQFIFFATFAQTFKSKIESVKSDGFYKIQLSPEIIAKSKNQLADLRLISSDGKEIPFILNSDPASFYEQDFVAFPIEENSNKGNVQTIVIKNPNDQTINNLVLEMKNAFGEKKIRISGSDDKKNWFMLHQGFPFTVSGDAENTKVYQAIDFPKADYKWFSISLIDTMPLSLNILRVGNYKQKVIFGNYTLVPVKKFIQKDSSDKKSYVQIILTEANVLDKLKVFVSNPEQYLRDVNLKSYQSIMSDSKVYAVDERMLTLNSDLENSFIISNTEAIKINNMVLSIENNDNQPLKIDSIQLQQLTTYLSAKLEKGKLYYLQFGDSTLEAPVYDLKYFENKIPRDIQVIKNLAVEVNAVELSIKGNKTLNTKIFIWIGLILAGLLLAYMTNKMLKEVKKRENG